MRANNILLLIPFGAVTLLVVGWLLWLHLAPVQADTVPVVGVDQSAPVFLCDDAPTPWRDLWLAPAVITPAAALLDGHGWSLGEIEIGPCDLCSHDRGITRCKAGRVALDIADQWFDDTHVGEARGGFGWATMLLPMAAPASSIGPDGDERDLPPDWRTLVLAHERLHAGGVGHTFAEGPVGIAHPLGSIMHPNVYGLGKGLEGVPRGR